MKRLLGSVVAVGMLFWVAGQATGQPSYALTLIEPPESVTSYANGINDAGQIVGLYNTPSIAPRGFLFSNGSYTALAVPGATYTTAADINATAQVVGSYIVTSGFHGFLYAGGNYTTFDVPGSTDTNAYGINASGQIVGGYGDAHNHAHGFLLSGGNYTTLDVPGSQGFFGTFATAINTFGQIVGRYNDATGDHGFLYSDGRYTSINVPGAIATFALGINDSGQILGSFFDASVTLHNFLLSNGDYITLDGLNVPGGLSTNALGINNFGDIVGSYGAEGGIHGFLATPTPVPEPSTLLLLSVGTMGMVGWVWRLGLAVHRRSEWRPASDI